MIVNNITLLRDEIVQCDAAAAEKKPADREAQRVFLSTWQSSDSSKPRSASSGCSTKSALPSPSATCWRRNNPDTALRDKRSNYRFRCVENGNLNAYRA